MNLPKTSLNVVYVEPSITMSAEEKKQQLTKFVALVAQIGFREYALNKDFAQKINNFCK